ncbi:hypothetical protein K443DRAFT_553245 [Laccaria amethystina LaAM-08-1]|uniref:Uncharacterized protein n=1 Tax=Laccaria amethystina LaAM-08-1 TaxID=1095629 RepID=A0A0C9WSB5_9AGAR|nr:hypothetical protein K443DRAFT_553245 [Laccaria amethystina LaAM-08-1]
MRSSTVLSGSFCHDADDRSVGPFSLTSTPHPIPIPHPTDEMLVLTQPPLTISNKGFIQPHRNHLPRRHRQKPAPPKLTLEPPVFLPVPFPVSAALATLAPSASAARGNPAIQHHSPAPPTSYHLSPPTGPLQPHISHLPRRRRLHTRHYHALAPARRKKKLERDMCMQRVASGVWVAFRPTIEGLREAASPYSSEDEGYRYGGEEHEMRAAWDKGLEERFGRIVTIVDAASPSPSSSSGSLTLTLERTREGAQDDDDGVALLTDAQIREGCAFLRGTTSPPSSPLPRYSSFPLSLPPPASSPWASTKARVLILAPRTRAVDALSLAAAYAVARGWGPGSVPRTPTSLRSSSAKALPDTTSTFSASMSCANNDARSKEEESNCEATTTTTPSSTGIPSSPPSLNSKNSAREDLELDLTHPIAEWSARVVPCPPLPLQLQPELHDEYTPVHALLMRLHDLDCQGGVVGGGEEDEEEGEGEEEGGLRDEWRGVLSWGGMWRVWDIVLGDD